MPSSFVSNSMAVNMAPVSSIVWRAVLQNGHVDVVNIMQGFCLICRSRRAFTSASSYEPAMALASIELACAKKFIDGVPPRETGATGATGSVRPSTAVAKKRKAAVAKKATVSKPKVFVAKKYNSFEQ